MSPGLIPVQDPLWTSESGLDIGLKKPVNYWSEQFEFCGFTCLIVPKLMLNSKCFTLIRILVVLSFVYKMLVFANIDNICIRQRLSYVNP